MNIVLLNPLLKQTGVVTSQITKTLELNLLFGFHGLFLNSILIELTYALVEEQKLLNCSFFVEQMADLYKNFTVLTILFSRK